ncbi:MULTISPECIES: ABC transporter ATP-binding protein [Rhodococcus]|jgi:ABC-type nitrate/sulfonate/bicarbonate transport system ATPase subunit|uniref:ABC transporter ATP-binding protein n=1 Tax=Rhodococcus globerulus TaxID=33008 RepID=A0ABU4BYQ4_RHOGO|nr:MULTISPECIES: ABC transporter ATP-binding protein [Rhodococcus]MDV6269298.1 ABC transporter ATP-binding protein [Rhodococcus globerulus]MDV8066647.1 ABC transporter ATP-binding protein [Rhodococcus sp. IEGM 1366]
MPDPIIALENVCKSYDIAGGESLTVLDNISFTVGEGDFVAVVGPSGSGKSTLLNILSGLQNPTNGSLEAPAPEEIGFVFQRARLLPWRTVEKNLSITREARAANRREPFKQGVGDYLEAVGLSDYADFYPAALSGGMQQRVSIARALATEPAMLLMDEPFSALDEMTARTQRAFLRDLWLERRPTVMFVTHNVMEAISLATSVVVLSSRPGRVLDHIVIDAEYPRSLTDPAVEAVHERVMELLGVPASDRVAL